MSELALGIHHAKAFRRAEADAKAIMELNDEHFPMFTRGLTRDQHEAEQYRWWVETFGASEQEFKEQRTALARRYRRLYLQPWRWRERRRIMAAYIRVEGILIAPYPWSAEWR